MPTFLLNIEKVLSMDDRVSVSIRELEGVSFFPTIVELVQIGEELFLYLAISLAAISAALVREEDGVQKPVYLMSQALRGEEERYPSMEKLAFALITTAQKLKPYFQAHTMIVLMDKPLRRAMSSPEAAGRIALWAIELKDFDVQYHPCIAIKGKIIADIIIEFTHIEGQGTREILQCNIHTDRSFTR